MLTPGFDPCLEEYKGKVLLRAKELDQLVNSGEVTMAAEVLVQLLHGAALLEYSDAKPLKVGNLVKFGPNGEQVSRSTQFTITIASSRTRDRAGNSKPEKPKPSIAQKRLNAAGRSLGATDLLIFLARSDNWYDLYKAMETARGLKGGKKKLRVHLEINQLEEEWDRTWDEANYQRHAWNVGPTTQPPNPPPFEEARLFVIAAVARLF